MPCRRGSPESRAARLGCWLPVKCPRSIPSTAPGRGCKDAASAAHRGLPESPRAWLTPSPSCWTLSNDGRNMVVARRRLFSPWTRQPTGYGCILWAGERRRRRGPSRRPHGPERASRQGCPPRKRRRASPRPSPTRRRSRRRGPPRSRGVAARAWASGLRHGAPKSQPAWSQLPDKSKRRPSPRPARSRPHVLHPTPKNEPRVDGI